jgi:hypothetical protein
MPKIIDLEDNSKIALIIKCNGSEILPNFMKLNYNIFKIVPLTEAD